jgi:hypothetical protein
MIGYSEIHSGKYRKVVSIEEDGENVCDQYVNSLDKPTRIKLMATMKVVADRLSYKNTLKFKKLRDDIWEFKSRTKTLNARVYCFFQTNKIVCTHGTNKQKKRQLDTEIAKAIRIRRRFIDEGGIKHAIKD